MKKILIVEDNEIDQFLNRAVIHKVFPGLEIVQVYDGVEALEYMQKSADMPDVILLDINMPRMNGHEFLAAYTDGNNRKTPVVVILTSSDQDMDKERSAQYDCVKDYMMKPLTPAMVEQLAAMLNS